jgi:hypothetical protein
MEKKTYDTTIARIAGNIAAGMVDHHTLEQKDADAIARESVAVARAIVAEVTRTS